MLSFIDNKFPFITLTLKNLFSFFKIFFLNFFLFLKWVVCFSRLTNMELFRGTKASNNVFIQSAEKTATGADGPDVCEKSTDGDCQKCTSSQIVIFSPYFCAVDYKTA